jgi:TRAP-type transport system periplasmic protein
MDRRHFLKTTAGAAGLTLTAPYIARAATMTMRFAHFAEEGHPANIAAKQFASQIEKRTEGAIKIAIFPNNQLGGPPEQAQQIKLGTIDMGLPTQGQLDKYDKAFATIELPFIFNGREDAFPSSMARPWNGWRRWRKSRVLCCCATGNTASATSPTACARSTLPTT